MKRATSSFDAAAAPLDTGISRLEASAGTGKTYTLSALYLRLIAEAGLEVGSILVTTFTIPATAELRDRIRALLRGAAAMFQDGPGEDPRLVALHPHYLSRAAEIRPRIERALRQFDDAAIFTIHGFCHRLLQERAFESGISFDAEALEDQSVLLREVAEDFWRRLIYPGDLRHGALAMLAGLNIGGLVPLLATCIARPTMTILPPWDADALARAEAAMRAALDGVAAAWHADEAGVRAIFADPAWAIKEMAKAEITGPLLDGLGRCLTDPSALLADYDALDFFTIENVAAQTGKRSTSPTHALFTACGDFCAARTRWRTAFEREFLAWAPPELSARKLQRNLLSFDDLLTRLRAALQGSTRAALIGATQQRFKAALVDEFQDTDPVQAEIFQQLFAGHGRVYLIGDPKQAIYGFRGADVFSYLAAAKHAEHSHELSDNQRSVTPLVEAVNEVFAHNPRAFVVDGIDFHRATAAGRRDKERLSTPGGDEPVFQFWLCSEAKVISKEAAEARLPQCIASAIIGQLSGDLRKGGTPLKPSDFAVLTANNRQAQLVQAALLAAGLPAVVLSNASVLQAPEAAEMLALVHAMASPANEGALRAALATTALGLTAAELAALAADGWDRRLEQFHRHHTHWLRDGFYPAFRALLVEWRIRPRLLSLPDGERRLTNLLHLAELLHHAGIAQRLGPAGLARWLAVQMHPALRASEEHELRLESDDDAVKVVTVHKSKGLEFGIVWCPFSWGNADLRKGEAVTFHDPANGGLVLDLGSPDQEDHRALAERERLAEQARLLYVALTRAQLQCHFVWGRFNRCANSAAAWVLHPPPAAPGGEVSALRDRELGDAELRADLARLAEKAPTAFAIADLPEPQAVRYQPSATPSALRQARIFTGQIRRDWAIGSFTSLTAGVDVEQPDYDRDPSPARPAQAAAGIHAFPRGRRAGTCLHEIFEELDFRDEDAIESLVAHKLGVFNFDRPEFRAAVGENIRATLAVELTPGLRLSAIPTSARLNELEFHLPVGRLDPARLRAVLGDELPFAAFSGFLKGFIDLVFEHDGRFYIADWKSNWLGASADDYTPEAMAAEMRRHHYGVQYQLYAVALHRYLARRIAGYDHARHFGGVFYVFLRGVDPARLESGIFRDRPTAERIAALEALLSTES